MITIEIVRKSDDTVLDVVTGDDREQVEAEANRRRPAGTYLRRLVPPRKRQESASVPDRMTTTTAEILTTSWLCVSGADVVQRTDGSYRNSAKNSRQTVTAPCSSRSTWPPSGKRTMRLGSRASANSRSPNTSG